MILFLLLSFSICLFPVNAAWADANFDKCKNITINSYSSTTLTNFPVYINLTYDSDMQPDFDDIRFYNNSCEGDATALKYEIENYTTSTRAHVWVKIPSLPSSGVKISVYYKNNTGVSSGEDKTNVWDSDYAFVYHMGDRDKDTGSPVIDSKGRMNGTKTNFLSSSFVDGTIGGGYNFTGVAYGSEFINVGTNSYLNNLGKYETLSVWLNYRNSAGTKEHFAKLNYNNDDRLLMRLDNTTMALNINHNIQLNGVVKDFTACPYNKNEWNHWTITYDNGNAKTYMNGVYCDGYSYSKGMNELTDGWVFTIGAGNNGGNFFTGYMDEYRFSNVTRSAGWINMTYHVMASQSSLVSFGTEQSINTCTAPDSGNWVVDCSNNCSWSSNQNVPGNMSITGSGHLKLSANLIFTSSSQYIFIGSGCVFEILSGGAIK